MTTRYSSSCFQAVSCLKRTQHVTPSAIHIAYSAALFSQSHSRHYSFSKTSSRTTSTRPHRGLPEGPVLASDVDAVRFSLGLRGYRMDEVDAVMSEMSHRIRLQEDRIAVLESRLPAADG